MIVSLTPFSIDEVEGSSLTVTCVAKHSSMIVWAHSDQSLELNVQVDNLVS